MATSRKRLFEEYDDLASAKSPNKAAKIHGMLTDITPMKAGKYFEGRIAEGSTSLRLVGFDKNIQQELVDRQEQDQPVMLNCQLQKSKYGEDIEVMVTRATKIEKSPRKFDSVLKFKNPTGDITMKQLQDLQNFQKVSVIIKVIQVENKMEIKPGLNKQDVTVADDTSNGRLTLWQDDIGKLEEGKSYNIKDIVVKSYDGLKYLTSSKSGCTITPIDDIGSVEVVPQEPQGSQNTRNTIKDAEIVGVAHIACHRSCLTCKAKIDPVNDRIGVCSKCSMTQRLDRCGQQLSAKLLIAEGPKIYPLLAFLPVIQLITRDDTISEATNAEELSTKLLMSDPFNLTFNAKEIITSVTL